jgi:hypothetical protein
MLAPTAGPQEIIARQALVVDDADASYQSDAPADWASTTTNSKARRFTREFVMETL